METRGRKRQLEAELAEESAPVETRAQKAARLAKYDPTGSHTTFPRALDARPKRDQKLPRQAVRNTPVQEPVENKQPARQAKRDTVENARVTDPTNLGTTKGLIKPEVKLEPELPHSSGPQPVTSKASLFKPLDGLAAQAGTEAADMDRRNRDALRRQMEDEYGQEDDGYGDEALRNAGALQGLLRKLGAGSNPMLDDIFSAGMASTSRFKQLLVQLKSDDPSTQLDGLHQLNDILSVAMEDALAMAPVESMVTVLVQLLNHSDTADILLLAARALTYLADVMPACCGSIVRHQAVPVLCARLLNIEYIDVAEQSLTCLSKLAVEHAHACVSGGALMACLSYLDFFEASVQRIAVATAAQMCRGLPLSQMQSINHAVPILTNLLTYQDAKVVENASLALTRIAETLQHSPQHLTTLCGQGLIANTLQLVAVSDTGSMTSPLEVSTYFGLIKLLTTCVSGSAAVAETLHQAGASKIIHKLLNSSPLFSTSAANSGSVLRTSDQLKEIISLTAALLPSMPDSLIVITQDLTVAADVTDNSVNEGDPDVLERRRFLADNLDLLDAYNQDVLPLLLVVYQGTMISQVKNKVLQTIVKILQYTPSHSLIVLLEAIPISSFTAGLFSTQEFGNLAAAVRIAEILQSKLPDIFTAMLLKEGVVHALEALAVEAPAPSPEKPKSRRSSSRLKGKKAASPEEAAPVEQIEEPSKALTLRQSCAIRAQQFIGKYYANSSGGLSLETEGVKLLKSLSKNLKEPANITQILKALQDRDGGEVSTFEFLKSGTVQDLRHFLTGGDITGEGRTDLLLKRLQQFCELTMAPGSTSGLQSLIHKLQEGLAAEDMFPVYQTQISMTSRYSRSYGGSRGSVPESGSLAAGLIALSQPFRLNLARASHETELGDYSVNTILIDPLATMSSLEDYLYPRIQRRQARLASPRGAAAQAGQAATDNAKPSNAADSPRKTETAKEGATAQAAVPNLFGKDRTNAEEATADPLRWESQGGRQSRKPASQTQPIPVPQATDNKTSTRSRITRAATMVKRALTPRQSGSSSEPAEPEIAHEDNPLEAHSLEEDVPMDEEEDYSDEEIDEDMADDMDDEDQLGMSQPEVHTVSLDEAQPNGGEPNTEAAPPASNDAATETAPREAEESARLQQAAARERTISALTSAVQEAAGRSYAQAAAGSQAGGSAGAGQEKLVFYLNDKALPRSHTIFQAVCDFSRAQNESNAVEGVAPHRRRLWEETHTLYYSRIENIPESSRRSSDEGCSESSTDSQPFNELLVVNVPKFLESAAQTKDILILLKLLEALNRLGGQLMRYQECVSGQTLGSAQFIPLVPREDLVSQKLTPKMAQQLKDVLSVCGGSIAPWIPAMIAPYKFLFPFDVRRRYFYCTAFGIARAILYLQAQQAADGTSASQDARAGRITRSKVRLGRKRLLESAAKVMEIYAKGQGMLELEFFNEAGTGLGPTLEFYTLISHELQKRGLKMWRGDHGEEIDTKAANPVEAVKSEGEVVVNVGPALPDKQNAERRQLHVAAPQGLFPAPIHPSKLHEAEKVLSYFKLLGQAVGKALQDNRMMDVALSYPFYRVALGEKLNLFNVREVDSILGKSLEKFITAHNVWLASQKREPLLVDGQPLAEMYLSFGLPGYPDYELKPNGSRIDITPDNLLEYVDAVVDATLITGIKAQTKAFREGVSQVMPIDSLKCFYPDEIEAVLCGQGELWTPELLIDAIKFDHGYTANSSAVKIFVEILSELDAPDQRRFLTFITGSPRLRPGGLAALQPRLTVVRKHPSSSSADIQPGSSVEALARTGSIVDGDLPSVMTCANYIKLPPYSSKRIMEQRLLYAIREGQGSFDLS